MLLGPAVSLRLRAWISFPHGPVLSLTALAPEPLLALSLGIPVSWKPGTVLTVSPMASLCMGPRASKSLLTQLYLLPDVLLRMPGEGDPENGETLQVGGDTPGWGWWSLSMTLGSLVHSFFVSLLGQEVSVKEGSLGFGTQQAKPCEGGFLTFLRCVLVIHDLCRAERESQEM